MRSSVEFREVEISDAEMILDWRLKDRVTRFMVTDLQEDLDRQRDWILKSRSRLDYYHWIIRIGSVDCGHISISDFNQGAHQTSWGYYIGDDDLLGLGAIIPPFLYNWLFGSLGIKSIDVEVAEENHLVLKLHEFHGYRRFPRRDREIVKNGSKLKLMSLQLDEISWRQQHRWAKYTADFPTSMWDQSPPLCK